MIKQAPSLGRIFTMLAFALSCFGILVFLWLAFGGSIPLKPEGYRVKASFPEATQLVAEAEVRISGVKVGRVKKKEPNAKTGLTEAVLEIDSRFAPIPRDSRAILRQKTLLGETYVELSPGSEQVAKVPDGGTLPAGRVSETVELDEILRTFDPVTRQKFVTWFDQQGRALSKHGKDINDALGNLTPFAEDTDKVLKILRSQSGATRRLVRDTGEVFGALTERQGQLRELIVNSNRVWETTARRDAQLEDLFRVFPTFLREGRTTTSRLSEFADNTNPLITQLRPAARELSPTLVQLNALAPDLRDLFRDIDPLVEVSRRGLPATEEALNNTRPVLARLDPFLRSTTPIFDYLGLYRREIAAFFANGSAVTQATGPTFAEPENTDKRLQYLRTVNPLVPENLAGYPRRLSTSRSNPYTEPGGYDKLRTEGHLEVFGSYLCTGIPDPAPPPPAPPHYPADLAALVNKYVFGQGAGNQGKAPPCDPQRPLGRLVDQPGVFPRLERLR
ncbi:MAG TPA: MlaD family protein [Thermoleophilaceae bacterium]|nr:MlaD family protein [Thermoleophilaceae bacterium]